MLRNAIVLMLVAVVFGVQAQTGPINACTTASAEEFIAAFKTLDASVSDVKPVSRSRNLAIDRAANLLVPD